MARPRPASEASVNIIESVRAGFAICGEEFTHKHKESLRKINRMESMNKLKACIDAWYEAAREAVESNNQERMKEIENRFEEINGKNAMERIEKSVNEIRETMRQHANEIAIMKEIVRKLTESRNKMKEGIEETHEKTRREYQREYQRAYRLKKKQQRMK